MPKQFKHQSKIKILLSDWSAIQYCIDFLLTDMVTEVDFIMEVSLFSNFSCIFLNPNLNCNCFNFLDMRNLQEQV